MSNEAPSPRLSRGTVARYATGSLGTGGFATLPGLVLAYYLTDSLAVAALAAGAIITLAKVWDVVIDPVIGALTDRELRTRGSRRRLMLIGACTLPLFFALTFAVPPGVGPVVGAIWVLIAFTLTATSFSLFQVPYIALPAELTPSYDERTRLLSWRVVVLTLAILLFGAGGPALRRAAGGDDELVGYLVMAIVAGIVIGIGMLIAVGVARRTAPAAATSDARVATPDPSLPALGPAVVSVPGTDDPRPDAQDDPAGERAGIRAHYAAGIAAIRRSAPFRALLGTFVLQALGTGLMLAGAQYVATWVLRSEAAVELLFVALIAPALFAAPVWGIIARRIGKERSFAIASGIFLVASFSIIGTLWAPGAWIYVPVGIAGLAYAGMQSLPMAMLPDVISHDEATSGGTRAGAFSGVWTAGETVGFALGATTLSIILALTGYVVSAGQTVSQPQSAVAGIVVSFSIVPAALIGLSLLTLARYRLRRTDIDGSTLARHPVDAEHPGDIG